MDDIPKPSAPPRTTENDQLAAVLSQITDRLDALSQGPAHKEKHSRVGDEPDKSERTRSKKKKVVNDDSSSEEDEEEIHELDHIFFATRARGPKYPGLRTLQASDPL